MIVRWVRARGWPWQTDLVVRDDAGRVLAHNTAELELLRQPRVDRVREALSQLQGSQTLLKLHYASMQDVRLQCDRNDEERLSDVLSQYGIESSLMDFAAWPKLQARLQALQPQRLWDLVADWFDEYQTGTPAGTSRQNPPTWLERAHPDTATYWAWLAQHLQAPDAWQLFCEHHEGLDLETLTMYDLLTYELAMRTEFADKPRLDLSYLGLE